LREPGALPCIEINEKSLSTRRAFLFARRRSHFVQYIYIYISIKFKENTYFYYAKYGKIKSQFNFFEGDFMRTEKILHRAIAVLSFMIIMLAGCGQTEEAITTTAAETAIVTTTTAAPEITVTTLAETTILTTTAETTPPETEPTTTASITTADNSSDTRSTEQKLSDIITANPNVEIGYALYNADSNKYLYHYNDEMEIDVSGEVPVYWLYRVLNRNELESEISPYFGKDVYEDSYVYNSYESGEISWFSVKDLIDYYFNEGDEGAKITLEIKMPMTYNEFVEVSGNVVEVEKKDSIDKSTVTQYVAKWISLNKFFNSNSEEAKFLKELFTNNDRDSFFYEGTGVLTVHAGDKIGSDCYDTGIINVGGTDYIFVIYTRNAESADIVREISRYFYDYLT
jgi:hypothetical protein